MNIESVTIGTFFGGSSISYASPKDQFSMFRNFRLWRDDAPDPAGSVLAAGGAFAGGQVVVHEELADKDYD